ncbi:MAG: UDP-4-amino-4,6-dideoxy-N-acetyl-beta-L-altrosamine transaminase [Tannerella sp.]|nr:UDP-4-amino-4,6-dideoxy-N-acetyl-beta-L-altrosamine transaminase [Tannerella sp.]
MSKKVIPYGRHNITDEDVQSVVNTLKSDFLTQGPKIFEFEQAFARYVGAKYAVLVGNATEALHISALSLGVTGSSMVLTTPITFVASANCIAYCGGKIDFVDIDPDTALMDLSKLEEKLSSKPLGYYSGVIPVDFAGLPVDMERLRSIANQYNLWIIEDACHAPGGYFTDLTGQKQYCGNGRFADISVFSFHPVKHIACGEGGMATTNDENLYRKLSMLRTHGITKDPLLLQQNHGGWYYEMQDLGYNYRMPDILASLGISQLGRASKGIARRIEIAKRYDEAFTGSPVNLNVGRYREGHAYHLYIIQIEQRKELYDFLHTNNIFAQVHYVPVHLMPYYKQFGWKEGDFPAAENYYKHCLSLPMYPTLTNEEQDWVIEKVKIFFNINQ